MESVADESEQYTAPDEPASSEQYTAPDEPASAEAQSQSVSGMSFKEFSHSLPGGSFPLANALRVHMKITHHDNDLRSEAEFKAKLAELTGENDG